MTPLECAVYTLKNRNECIQTFVPDCQEILGNNNDTEEVEQGLCSQRRLFKVSR